MAEARALKLCTNGDYIKFDQRDDKSPLKGAWFCSRDQVFECTAVCIQKTGCRRLSITPPTFDAGAAYTKA